VSPTLESNKRPGVRYALSADGIELPIVDVTHPAFAVTIDDATLAKQVAAFVAQGPPLAKLPSFLRRWLLRRLLRGSTLARGVARSNGSYLPGMDTYLLKLGPDNLGAAYTTSIDRKIAAALPSFAVRLRLQDVAGLLADAARPLLAAGPGRPLHFVNIAGGPAMDSLNALLLLARDARPLLEERPIRVAVLDLDDAGPTFGGRALAALRARDAPLHGLDLSLEHVRYDWSDPDALEPTLARARTAGAIVAASSEGGLFEYGSDEHITANLARLRAGAPTDVVMAGSVTRADGPVRVLQRSSAAATRPRGLAVFQPLAAKAGWAVARAIERPFSDQVLLARG
jgi:hypothetical protein